MAQKYTVIKQTSFQTVIKYIRRSGEDSNIIRLLRIIWLDSAISASESLIVQPAARPIR